MLVFSHSLFGICNVKLVVPFMFVENRGGTKYRYGDISLSFSVQYDINRYAGAKYLYFN